MRRAWFFVALATSAACGGDDHHGGSGTPPDAGELPTVPLAAASEMVIVAHEGDDLRYLQPDLGEAIAAGGGVTAVYVTDGADEQATAGGDPGHNGARNAYASIAGMSGATWTCGAVALGAQHAEHCRLDAARISLVFLGYPASVADGSSTNSLLHLWEAKVTSVTNSAAPLAPTYGQMSLIAAVSAAIDGTMPSTLRTLEVAATHGSDHSDHMLVGALAVLATAASSAAPQIAAYRGDNIAGEAANADAATLDRTTTAYGYYAACATACAPCGMACTAAQLSTADAALIQRHYAVTMQAGAAGLLKIGGDCVALPTIGSNGTIGSCTGAPTWTLDQRGTLKSSDGTCMKAILTGEIVGSGCTDDGAGGRFFLDAEGHLWNGVVPGAQADMTFAHLQCVGNAGGRPRDLLCGGLSAPVVDLPPEP